MCRLRGVAMVFQEPMTALNRCTPWVRQVPLVLHQGMDAAAAPPALLIELLRAGGAADQRNASTHTRQLGRRPAPAVKSAMALACEPLLIADDPRPRSASPCSARSLDLIDDLVDRRHGDTADLATWA